jgi:hypothetical protein
MECMRELQGVGFRATIYLFSESLHNNRDPVLGGTVSHLELA